MTQYACGHETSMIIIDDTPIGLAKYLAWYDSVGIEGSMTKCFDCYLKEFEVKQ